MERTLNLASPFVQVAFAQQARFVRAPAVKGKVIVTNPGNEYFLASDISG
jgi:hypothetical protein